MRLAGILNIGERRELVTAPIGTGIQNVREEVVTLYIPYQIMYQGIPICLHYGLMNIYIYIYINCNRVTCARL